MIRVFVSLDALSPAAEMADFDVQRGDGCGAVVSFVGYCRGQSAAGPVEEIELQYYPGFTEAEIQRLAKAIAERHAVSDLLVVHRAGIVPAGAPIVLVAALSEHRAPAFAAVEELMDYLKTDAPFWKRETGPNGARWIEPTSADRARREECAT